MTDANYIRHFKVLGKLAKLYDDAGANDTAMRTLLATFVDQYAEGTSASLSAINIFPTYTRQWANAIGSSPASLQAIAVAAAGAYLISADFTADLTTTPSATTPAAVLIALATDMGAGVDDKTLSTEATSGLVNFFDAVQGAEGTWNTEDDATADYKDSVYVVSAVV